MSKKMIMLLLILSALFIVSLNAVFAAFESVPTVGPAGCVSYAQARASSPSLAQKSDAELHSLGFCAGNAPTPIATISPSSETSLDKLQAEWDADDCRWGGTSRTEARCAELEILIEQARAAETSTPVIIATPEPEPTETLGTAMTATETPEPTETIFEEPSNTPDDAGDSEVLLEAVLGRHKQELDSIQNYYARPAPFPGMAANEEGAKKKFDETRPLGLEVVNAKNDYQDALKTGASEADLAGLKTVYEQKTQELKDLLRDEVLSEDSGNPEALWQLGTLSKWEGNNRQSYEYYRDALLEAKARNPFQYQQLLDSIKDPGFRMGLLQNIEPDVKLMTLPTTETSPFLKGLKENLGVLVGPVDETMRVIAETTEKMSRAFSTSDIITQAKKELGISPLGGGEESDE